MRLIQQIQGCSVAKPSERKVAISCPNSCWKTINGILYLIYMNDQAPKLVKRQKLGKSTLNMFRTSNELSCFDAFFKCQNSIISFLFFLISPWDQKWPKRDSQRFFVCRDLMQTRFYIYISLSGFVHAQFIWDLNVEGWTSPALTAGGRVAVQGIHLWVLCGGEMITAAPTASLKE